MKRIYDFRFTIALDLFDDATRSQIINRTYPFKYGSISRNAGEPDDRSSS